MFVIRFQSIKMALIYVGFPKSKQCLKYNTNSGDSWGDKKAEVAV